jgi:hypothetical protein
MPSMYFGERLQGLTTDEDKMIDQCIDTTADVREAILKAMSPKDIATMISLHFEESTEDLADTMRVLGGLLKERNRDAFYASIHQLYNEPVSS